MCIRDSSYAA